MHRELDGAKQEAAFVHYHGREWFWKIITMPATLLYNTWFCQIRGLCSGERVTRIRNLVWLIGQGLL